jgi:hypothetical protein
MKEKKLNFDYKEQLKNNNVIAIVPTGNSMWPTLKNRKQSVIITRKTQRLKPFDVALYLREDGTYVLHRVMKVTDTGYITCGDSQAYAEQVKEDSVIGVMTSFYQGKKCIEVTDPKYIEQVQKWYSNESKRAKKSKKFFDRQRIKWKIKYYIKRIIGQDNV